MTALISQYRKTKNCYTGEIGNYGYAFVPGSSKGIVLLDLKTKNFLDNFIGLHDTNNIQQRLELLFKNGLIQKTDEYPCDFRFNRNKVKTISIWLHVSNKCNLDCPYCYIAGKNGASMSVPVANLCLDKLEHTAREHRLKTITIRFAGGEPILNRKIIAYFAKQANERFAKNGISTNFIILTNGTIVDTSLIELIHSYSMRISFSLDGMKDWHDKTRSFKSNRGSFDKVYKNLELCLKSSIKPTILTTVTRANILGIPELNRFLVDGGLPFRYSLYRDNISKDCDISSNFIDDLSKVLNNCYDYYINAINNQRTTSNHQLCDINLNKKPRLRSCDIGYSGVTINHEGNVFLCQAAMDKKPIGHVSDNRTLLQMAWHQKTFPELRTKSVYDYKDCKNCQWMLVCAGGCPVTNFNTSGSVASSSPYCNIFKEMIPRLIEIKALQLLKSHLKTKKKGGDQDEQ